MPVSEVYETGQEKICWQVNHLLIGTVLSLLFSVQDFLST